jgi:hypothetical protein
MSISTGVEKKYDMLGVLLFSFSGVLEMLVTEHMDVLFVLLLSSS